MQRPYHPVTRIGNWSEDLELERARAKEYLIKKEKGFLTSQQLASYNDPVELTQAVDGNIGYDQIVMIKNVKTNGVLSTDLGDRLRRIGEVFAVTTTPSKPCARNVFILKRIGETSFEDSFLRYGDKVQIVTTPFLTGSGGLRASKLYLSSQLITPDVYSKFSHFQEVCTTSEDGYNTAWEVVYYDPKMRLENEGSPVKAGASVVIRHCLTGANLSSDTVPYRNNFGTENEIFCRTMVDIHKAETTENIWILEDRSLRVPPTNN